MRTLAIIATLVGFIGQLLLVSMAIDYELIGQGLHPALAAAGVLVLLLLQLGLVNSYKDLGTQRART